MQTVDKLREHLNRHLPRIGKKKVDLLVVSYVAKLVGRLCVCVLIKNLQNLVFKGDDTRDSSVSWRF